MPRAWGEPTRYGYYSWCMDRCVLCPSLLSRPPTHLPPFLSHNTPIPRVAPQTTADGQVRRHHGHGLRVPRRGPRRHPHAEPPTAGPFVRDSAIQCVCALPPPPCPSSGGTTTTTKNPLCFYNNNNKKKRSASFLCLRVSVVFVGGMSVSVASVSRCVYDGGIRPLSFCFCFCSSACLGLSARVGVPPLN